MKNHAKHMFTTLLPFLLMMTAFAIITSPLCANAITYGEFDNNNTYSNTGAFLIQSPKTPHKIFVFCSGTLIAPTVFLTAAHCTEDFINNFQTVGWTAFVSFDKSIPFGGPPDPTTNLIPVNIDGIITNPNYSRRQSDSGDIGVLILPEGSTSGITPATLPTFELLDELATRNGLKDAIFTPVGYGLQDRVVGGGVPFFENENPVHRMFASSSFNALNPGYLRLSQNPATGDSGSCYGDSGGPIFLDVDVRLILVASTVTGDSVCRATNVDYRLDTSSAREFLGQFVTLP